MARDGKGLEALVAFVEKTLLPQGFMVNTNAKVFDDDGHQAAEFDVEVRGRVGTTDLHWLIECRDRPGSGAAPASWIEQLVGRRNRFHFNKVTAVSTTGFAPAARKFAAEQAIEIREVSALAPEQFDWLLLRAIRKIASRVHLTDAKVGLAANESPTNIQAVNDVLSAKDSSEAILRNTKTGVVSPLLQAFLYMVEQEKLLHDVVPDAGAKPVSFVVEYTNDEDHFVIDTENGPVRVRQIHFSGELQCTTEDSLGLVATSEYRNVESGEVISQVATFEPLVLEGGTSMSLELHKLTETGETHIVMRATTNPSGS